MKRLPVIIVAVLMVALGASALRNTLAPRKVIAADPKLAPSDRISCLGKIIPGEKVLNVTGPYTHFGPSIVSELLVKRGQKVEKHALLAKLHNYPLAEAQLAQSEAEAKVAEQLLEQVKAGEKQGAIAAQEALVLKYDAELKNARVVLTREEQLLASQAISPNDFDRSELNWRIAQKNFEQATNTLQSLKEVRQVDVELAEARIAAARAAVLRMRTELELSLVRAPIDGTILEIRTYPGEVVEKEPIVQIGDLEKLRIEAEVYVSDIARVKTGANAIISGQGFAGEIPGTVVEVGLQVDQSALFNPDPATFSDKRVVKAWIKPEDAKNLAGLVNHQVNVVIFK